MTTTPLEDARERLARIIDPEAFRADVPQSRDYTQAHDVRREIARGKAAAILSALAEKEGKSGSIPELPSWTPPSGAIVGNDLLWRNPAPHAAQAGPTGTWRTFTTAEFENARADALAAADLPCAPNAHPESGVKLDAEPILSTGDVPSEPDTREFVWRALGGQVVTPKQLEEVVRKVQASFAFLCQHTGWSFAVHGRGCPHCGRIVADFGD